jgi:hypothetical protein
MGQYAELLRELEQEQREQPRQPPPVVNARQLPPRRRESPEALVKALKALSVQNTNVGPAPDVAPAEARRQRREAIQAVLNRALAAQREGTVSAEEVVKLERAANLVIARQGL